MQVPDKFETQRILEAAQARAAAVNGPAARDRANAALRTSDLLTKGFPAGLASFAGSLKLSTDPAVASADDTAAAQKRAAALAATGMSPALATFVTSIKLPAA